MSKITRRRVLAGVVALAATAGLAACGSKKAEETTTTAAAVETTAAASGTGKTIAADDISSVLYQRVKIALGAADAYDMDLDSGQQTMANSLPVAIASNQSSLGAEKWSLTRFYFAPN